MSFGPIWLSTKPKIMTLVGEAKTNRPNGAIANMLISKPIMLYNVLFLLQTCHFFNQMIKLQQKCSAKLNILLSRRVSSKYLRTMSFLTQMHTGFEGD